MNDNPDIPAEMKTLQTRVYYEPDTGEVIEVHTIVAPADMTVDAKLIEDETSTFEEMLAKDHDHSLKSLDVDEEALNRMDGKTAKVDLETGQLVFEEAEPEE